MVCVTLFERLSSQDQGNPVHRAVLQEPGQLAQAARSEVQFRQPGNTEGIHGKEL
jgi:hypothetical protein